MENRTVTHLIRLLLVASLTIGIAHAEDDNCGGVGTAPATSKAIIAATANARALEVAVLTESQAEIGRQIDASTSCTISTLSSLIASLIPTGLFGLLDSILSFDLATLIDGAINSALSSFTGDLACRIANTVTGAVARPINNLVTNTTNNAIGSITNPINNAIGNATNQVNNVTTPIGIYVPAQSIPNTVPNTPVTPVNTQPAASTGFLSNLACRVLNKC